MLYGLASIFALILLKEAGIPIPVPADLIMVGVAARAASGQWSLPAVILTVEAAMVIGGTIQFLAARGPGRRVLYRFGRYVGLTPARLERAASALQRGGVATVALDWDITIPRSYVSATITRSGTPKPTATRAPIPTPQPTSDTGGGPLGGDDNGYLDCIQEGNDPFTCMLQQ